MTEDNRLIEKTSCSQNGFFLLPITERRRYLIKVFSPDNLAFEPESRELDFVDKTDSEIKRLIEQTDGFFKFIGFALHGHVSSHNSRDKFGPQNVPLGLYDLEDRLLKETVSVQDGLFVFEKLQTGNYSVKVIEKKLQDLGYSLSPNRNEKRMKCEVAWGKEIKCQGSLVIYGYSFKAIIKNEENPLNNFYVFLYDKNPNASPSNLNCQKPFMANHPMPSLTYICYEITNQQGIVSFGNLSYGDYFLSIKPLQDEKRMEIEPIKQLLEIRHSSKTQEFQFQVNRFSIQGKVVDTKGFGISNVTISLDGEEKAKTDQEGNYLLEKVKSGTYILEGLHDHLFFEPIHELKLSIGLKQIPNLVLTYLHLCGKVMLNFDNLFQENQETQKPKITIYLEDSKQEKRTTFPDINGQYCFEAKPGIYSIYTLMDKSLNDITLFPSKHTVEVMNSTRLDLDFHRPKVSITGKVTYLPGLTDQIKEKTKVKIIFQQKSMIYSLASNGEFIINNVLSGNYELSIENEDICWEKPSLPLEIRNNVNITNLLFQQKGFALRYELVGSDIEADVREPNGVNSKWIFSSSNSFVCVNHTGKYQIKPHKCASYKEEFFIYNTEKAEKILLIPEKHLISGELTFNASKTTITKELLEKLPRAVNDLNYLQIESYSYDKSTLIETAKVPFVYIKNSKDKNVLTFSYQYYVQPFTINKIVPTTNTTVNLDKTLYSFLENLLFYPQIREITIDQSCQLINTGFIIKAGLIIVGKIIPQNIENINLTIYQDNKPLDLTINVSNGEFRVGPLIDASEYHIEAIKENYRFSQVEKSINDNILNVKLMAQKLSDIKVLVLDSENRPISGVSVFISSTAKNEKLKLNSVTDESGSFMSNNLVKGEYMVKCSLKEYSFEPNQKIVNILEGENAEIVVYGKQIAFSLYGNVLRLTQEGLENIMVDLYEDNKLKDSVKTNAQGAFRIRALEPYKHYQLMLRNSEFFHYYKPKNLDVYMKSQDIKNLEFIVFEKKSKYWISGNIDFDEKFQKEEIDEFQNFEIELFEFSDQQNPITDVKKLFINKYFEFEDLPMKEYVVKLTYKKTKNSLAQEISKVYNLKELHSHKDENEMHKKIIIPKILVDTKKGQAQTFSLLAPVVLLFLLICLLNLDTTKETIVGFLGFFKKK